jgi:glycosyltransferase involved in cell wall biosynthesis
MKPPFLSVIFSFRNEEDVLQELISRTKTVLTQEKENNTIAGWELIFVNDASNDRSLEIILQQAQNTKGIKIITMSRVFGVAPCVMAGLAHAQGDAAVYMDADLQDPPELIPEMLKAMQEQNADVVHTVRRSRQGESAFKLFVTKIGYQILNRYSNVPIPQEAGDFKLLSRRVADHLLQFKEINPFMRGLVAWVGFKQIFITYDRQPRFAGKSKFFVLGKKVISNFLNSAIINFSSVPLKIASYCGLGAILIDILVAIHALIQKFSGVAVPGWTAIMLVIIFLGGVQLFCIGMIGLYLNYVHEQCKTRPNYIIESTYGFNP